MQTSGHVTLLLTELHVPTTLAHLRRSGDDKIKTMRKFLKDYDWPGEQFAFAVYLRADILTNTCPPNVPLGYQWWFILDSV